MSDIKQYQSPSASGEASAAQKTNAVTQSATEAGGGVVQSAKEQGMEVASEAGRQAQNLYGQMRAQVNDQASAQQKRAADGLHALSDEVGKMAEQGGGSGPGSQVAQQASDKIDQMAHWLHDREPGQILDEITSYARRSPGTFLIAAAALGAFAGRLTKNLAGGSGERGDGDAAEASSSHLGDQSTIAVQPGAASLGMPTTAVAPASHADYEEFS